MLHDAHAIRDLAKAQGQPLSGVLRAGVPATIGPSLLPRVIPRLRSTFPSLKLYIREETPQQLPRLLADGDLDFIIAPLPAGRDGLASTVLFAEPIYLAMAYDHPLADKKEIQWSDLHSVEVLALGQGHQLHDLVLSLCEKSGARLRYDYEGTSLDTLREMVSTGLGVTFLPGLYVHSKLGGDMSLAIREVAGGRLSRTIGMTWREATPCAASYAQLAREIQDELLRALPDFAPAAA
jgi:LysR family transcriptional regulator, hydrogen peroxide-inducible genes activator